MFFDKKKYIQVSGELFREVQLKKVFKDSKTFVDSVPKEDPSSIRAEYLSKRTMTNFNLIEFVKQKFILPEDEVVKLTLPQKRSMEEHISLLWDYLIRIPKTSQNYSTLIPLIDEYIIPGGRFREIYYWDSYFTMLGLYTCNRMDLLKKMFNNFSYLIENLGFIPNGNRVYYLSRSQPPFFSLMATLILKERRENKTDLQLAALLEKEYNFWMKRDEDKLEMEHAILHVVKVKSSGILNRYFDTDNIPREESYYEDTEAFNTVNEKYKNDFYGNIRAAGESGWDFSSRWFEDEKNLTTLIGSEIIPIDLNCLLAYLERLLSGLNFESGNKFKSELFNERFEARLALIHNLLWNDEAGFFFDYNYKTGMQKKTYSLAGMFPLFFGYASKLQAEKASKVIERNFLKEGGVVTTPNHTSQQWDAPNGWAPLQWITIVGLRNYGYNQTADKIKERWIRLNNSVFEQTGKMFEKYNVENISIPGGGGEYPLQDGFGWTNGVAIALLKNLDLEFTTRLI